MSMKVKFILTYVAGIVTGIVLIFAVGLFMAKSVATSTSNKDVVMFEKPRGVVPGKVFKVMQVLPDGSALAMVADTRSDNWGTVVFFACDESTSYYDSQKINVPKGKVVKQVGTYSYMTQNEMYKTVPVVEIMAE